MAADIRNVAVAPALARNDDTPVHTGVSGDGETQTRTGDTTIFSRVLYQLSYLAVRGDASGSEEP